MTVPPSKESGADDRLWVKDERIRLLEAERDALRETLEEIERAASFDRGHPTFDKIASKARVALGFLP